jgi:hypothetical protein
MLSGAIAVGSPVPIKSMALTVMGFFWTVMIFCVKNLNLLQREKLLNQLNPVFDKSW